MAPNNKNSNQKRHFVLYGKGGIGKTTVATNLAAALLGLNRQVLVVGCSPKSSLMDVYQDGPSELTILDLARKEGSITAQNIRQVLWQSPGGVFLVESGGPEPGIGCAGRGLTRALTDLHKYGTFVEGMDGIDYALYDVIGDVVCGGFATPMRGEGLREVFVVTSGELMSLYAANNIAKAVVALESEGGRVQVKMGGFIANMREVPREREILETFSEMTRVPILAYIPRDASIIRRAERAGQTVVEADPASEVAEVFRRLATTIDESPQRISPTPIENYQDLFDMFMRFQETQVGVAKTKDTDYAKKIPAIVVERDKPKRISVYGTGGIGKSTVSSNISASLVLLSERVYQIGCDPKRDSIATLCGELKATVLDTLRAISPRPLDKATMNSLVFEGKGFNGRLLGSECGGPSPGKGCGGKGVEIALTYIEQYKIVDDYEVTFVLYDVLGDTVCGGFANPLKFAPQTYIVTSGEIATMVQAMKIAQSVHAVSERGVNVGIGGIISNLRGLQDEQMIVEKVFEAVGLPVVYHIPRSPKVQEAENLKQTVVRAFPDSDQASCYKELATRILANEKTYPLTRNVLGKREIQQIVNRYSEQEILA